jgi:hypothetical protein
MALKYDLDIGSVYNIPLLAPAILGTSYDNATVLALLDYTSAIALEDVSALHSNILGLLATGTPNDPSKLVYVKIRSSTGDIRVLAFDWIASQPTLVSATTVTVTINNVNHSEIPAIASCLRANGFTSFTIS